MSGWIFYVEFNIRRLFLNILCKSTIFYFHSPVSGTVLDVRTIDGISGSGGVVVWDSGQGRYEYANPGEPGLKAGTEVRKGDELGFFLCGGSDVVLLFRKNANLQLIPDPGRHLLMGEELLDLT